MLGGQQVSNPPGFPGVGPNSYYAAAGRVNRLMERLLVATRDLQLFGALSHNSAGVARAMPVLPPLITATFPSESSIAAPLSSSY